jgi:hypothetical protein
LFYSAFESFVRFKERTNFIFLSVMDFFFAEYESKTTRQGKKGSWDSGLEVGGWVSRGMEEKE